MLNDDKAEAACTLLNTGNKYFENGKIVEYTNSIFARLENVLEQQLTSNRIRFLVMNVLDARRANWN